MAIPAAADRHKSLAKSGRWLPLPMPVRPIANWRDVSPQRSQAWLARSARPPSSAAFTDVRNSPAATWTGDGSAANSLSSRRTCRSARTTFAFHAPIRESSVSHVALGYNGAVHRTYKRAEQKHIDVDAVPILQVEAFFLHGVILVDRKRERPKPRLRFAHVLSYEPSSVRHLLTRPTSISNKSRQRPTV